MNIVRLAMRRPVTIFVVILAVSLGGGQALRRIPQDIFPRLDIPVIYVAQPYAGMDAAQMEGYLTYHYEVHFLYINGIERIESKSIQDMALIKLQFHPGTDMAEAMAETLNQVVRSQEFMPRGSVPPFVIRYDAGSVPVGDLVLSSGTRGATELQDLAENRIRPMFATLPGISAPPPFGGSERSIVINLDPERLRAFNMSPDEVVEALAKTNTLKPNGNAWIGTSYPEVSLNSVVQRIQELEHVPVRTGTFPAVFIRDVGTVVDGSEIVVGYALVNGRRTVYLPVVKRADASTLDVVDEVRRNLPRFQAVLPDDVRIDYAFDQSHFVTQAIWNLTREGLFGALLTGLMALLFLRDGRSALIVVVSIPLSLLAAILGLWMAGQTVNLMTLGGLALSVGILVDQATVVIENIHTHRARGKPVALAALDAGGETLVPNLLSMLCILAVFTPSFSMTGAIRSLFVPLSLAVGFALVASYVLSATLVPILAARMLRAHGTPPAAASGSARFSFDAFRDWYARVAQRVLRYRGILIGVYLIVSGVLVLGIGSRLGTEIFPASEEGQFLLRFRAPTGTRIEETEAAALKLLDIIRGEVGSGNVETSLGYIGMHPSSHPINAIYLWSGGPEEGVLQVQLKEGAGGAGEDLRDRLRRIFAARMPELRVSFEPGDIVSRVLSFGSPTPVQVTVSGIDLETSRGVADRLLDRLSRIPSLRDVQIEQGLDYPAVKVSVDRERAGLLGLTMDAVAGAFVPATSSSRYVQKNFWSDPKTGVSYQVEVEYPVQRLDSIEEVRNIPVVRNGQKPFLLRNIARVDETTAVAEYDRHNLQRTLSLTANISGEDLGRVAGRVARALEEMEKPPPGVTVKMRGQIVTLRNMFDGLAGGLAVTVVAIFLLLAANFQSWRLSLVVVSTVPAVLVGVAALLAVTGTTLNIQSFMGGIMSVGVAVANAILLVTFAERARVAGQDAAGAALEGARSRLRPILMTSLAMMAGMVPMALGLGEGGEQAASLGRAVIGGLASATLATLLILPSVYAFVQGRVAIRSASMDPHDPDSAYYAAPDGARL